MPRWTGNLRRCLSLKSCVLWSLRTQQQRRKSNPHGVVARRPTQDQRISCGVMLAVPDICHERVWCAEAWRCFKHSDLTLIGRKEEWSYCVSCCCCCPGCREGCTQGKSKYCLLDPGFRCAGHSKGGMAVTRLSEMTLG